MADKIAVINFGRFQPPTIGHQEVIDTMVEQGKSKAQDAEVKQVSLFVFVSQTQDKKKNPLSVDERESILTEAVKDANIHVGVEGHNPKTMLEAAAVLNDQGFNRLVVVVGSDRVSEFKDVLDRYNGQETKAGVILYEYDEIEVIQAGAQRQEGELDPDSDMEVTEASGSAARQAAVQGDFDSFLQIFILDDEDMARETYESIRTTHGVPQKEESDEVQEKIIAERSKIQDRRINIREELRTARTLHNTGIVESVEDRPSDDPENITNPMTKTFVHHGKVDLDIEETTDVVRVANINLRAHKAVDGKFRESFMLDGFSINIAEAFSDLVEDAQSNNKLFEVVMAPLPKKAGHPLHAHRGKIIRNAVRYMPPELSKHVLIRYQ